MINENDILEQPIISTDEAISSLQGAPSGQMNGIIEIEKMVNDLIQSLPKINKVVWRQEMENMVVPMQQNPTTFDINEGLAL